MQMRSFQFARRAHAANVFAVATLLSGFANAQGTGAYRVTYRTHTVTERRGQHSTVEYVAELRPDPTSNELHGSGRYSAEMVQKPVNCSVPDQTPQSFKFQGHLEAEGSVGEVQADLLRSTDAEAGGTDRARAGQLLMFVLTTTDWPKLPMGGYAQTPEDKEFVKGAGTVGWSQGVPLHGGVGTIHQVHVRGANECDGKITETIDISVKAPAAPPDGSRSRRGPGFKPDAGDSSRDVRPTR